MTFMLKETGTSLHLHPALQQEPPSFAETFQAGDDADRIETDRWQTWDRRQRDVLADMVDVIGDDWGDGPAPIRTRSTQKVFSQKLDYALEVMQGLRNSSAVGKYNDFPATREEFSQQVSGSLIAELDDAKATLNMGSGLAGFLGASYGALKDENTVLSLPFGAASGSRILAGAITEGAISAGAELMMADRLKQQAERLGLPEPNILANVATAGVLGAGLGGAITGAQRFLQYRKVKNHTQNELRPAGTNGLDHERNLAQATDQLTGGRLAIDQTRDGQGESGTLGDILRGPGMGKFDFKRGGNAGPDSNRVGYVFGRLLELGYDPHIAAGLVGNFMVESTVGVNPQAVGDGVSAFGIAQWNDRRPALFDFARKRGKDPGDLDTQIAFVHHELTGSEARAMARISGARDAREAAAMVSQYYERPGIPHLAKRQAYAAAVMNQFDGGQVPRWEDAGAIVDDASGGWTGYGTSRGYTGNGQVMVNEDMRIDVSYEVVDASLLRRASGDLQPRDRSRAASDAWVNDTAARLDPALLMPAPTADRGAPIVGPDNVIESGNGRFAGIIRAYDTAPDRADAYRRQIELTTGQPIPEGIDRPVLVARRTTELDNSARRKLVIDAQDSGVARMTATERAQIGQRAMTADALAHYKPGIKLTSADNRDFVRRFADTFPRAERNAFIGPDGRLSADGVRQVRDALFARAWDAPDIQARVLEGEAGELKSLLTALEDAAPQMAMLRADIDAGLVRSDMDITHHILEALRLIIAAREQAGSGRMVADLVDQLLAEVDLLDGALSPLTQALVRMMMPNGKQAPARKISDLLRRYADEARKAGQTGDALLDAPGPLDVLKRIAPEHFGSLTEIGTLRGATARDVEIETMPDTAFAEGASSPGAEQADALIHAELSGTDIDPETKPDIDAETEVRAADRSGEMQPELAAITFEDPNTGITMTGREILNDLDADEVLETVIDLCVSGGRNG